MKLSVTSYNNVNERNEGQQPITSNCGYRQAFAFVEIFSLNLETAIFMCRFN
jgi:hypothetical protein